MPNSRQHNPHWVILDEDVDDFFYQDKEQKSANSLQTDMICFKCDRGAQMISVHGINVIICGLDQHLHGCRKEPKMVAQQRQ